MLANIPQMVASGIVTGAIYALVALSIVIIYKASHVVNFGGGEMVMVGAYVAFLIIVGFGLPYFVAFGLAAIIAFVIGAAFASIVIGRIAKRHRLEDPALVPIVIATFGLSYLVKGIVRMMPYTDEVQSIPPLISGPPFFIGSVVLARNDVAIVLVTAILVCCLWLFFRFTMIGKALNATSQNARAAILTGIPLPQMRMLVWGLAGTVAGFAGLLVGPKLLISPDMGSVLMLGLAAAVTGGFSSLPGAIVGGMVVGIVQNLAGFLLGAHTLDLAPFVIIMLVLIIRPQGIMGGASAVRKI